MANGDLERENADLRSRIRVLERKLDQAGVIADESLVGDSFSTLSRAAKLGWFRYDPSKPVVEWSSSLAEMFGSEEPTIPLERLVQRVFPADLERLSESWPRLALGPSPKPFELRAETADGALRSFWVVPVLGRDGDGPQVVRGVVIDVTTRVELERNLRQAQKMEALGKIAAGVAHDFNNLLTVVACNAALLESEHDPELALEISGAARAGASLTKNLLTFSREAVLEPRRLQVETALATCFEIVERTIGDDVRLERSLEPQLPEIVADPGQLEQIVLNLVINAREAMPEGGNLTIEARRKVVDSGLAERQGVDSGDYVCIAVTDTGMGIDDLVLPRIFEPFFTTKAAGKGAGLGLSTVYGAVKQAGGFVEVSTRQKRGTSIRVHLPAARSEFDDAQAFVTPPLSGPARILLVEDSIEVGRSLARTLRAAGHTVHVCHDPLEALRLIETGERFTLLVTDYLMPAMTGLELVARTRAIAGVCPVLVLSGWGFDSRMIGHLERVDALRKPLSARDLLSAVDRLVSRRS